MLRHPDLRTYPVTFYNSDGSPRQVYELPGPDPLIVGTTPGGQLAYTQVRPDFYIGEDDGLYNSAFKTATLAVDGKYALLDLERDQGLRLLDTSRQVYIRCPLSPPGRLDAVSLTTDPLSVAIYRAGKGLVEIYRFASGKTDSRRLNPRPSRYQAAEIHLDGRGRLYYMADDTGKLKGEQEAPECVERPLRAGETYYERCLVSTTFDHGAPAVLAKVRTAGSDPQGAIAYDMQAKFPGDDIVVFGDYLLVRADSVVFKISAPVGPG